MINAELGRLPRRQAPVWCNSATDRLADGRGFYHNPDHGKGALLGGVPVEA
jgi:hypothetical protein